MSTKISTRREFTVAIQDQSSYLTLAQLKILVGLAEDAHYRDDAVVCSGSCGLSTLTVREG